MFRTTLKARRATLTHARQSWFRPGVESLEDRVVPSLPEGTLLLATAPSSFSSTPSSSYRGLVAVNPANGQQSLFTPPNAFTLPTYIAEGPDGSLYVTDLQA